MDDVIYNTWNVINQLESAIGNLISNGIENFIVKWLIVMNVLEWCN